MKLDFDQLRDLGDKMHHDFLEQGDPYEQLDQGEMVYSIEFTPSNGRARVHVQWPYFRNLVANESDYPATYKKVDHTGGELWLSWTCHVCSVEVVTCMDRQDIINDVVAVYPAWRGHPNLQEIDIEELVNVYMNATGWNTVTSE